MALLVLEDGRSFTGFSFGASGECFGEAVFVTAMTGYQETLTDPSYHRQVVVATSPQIGNTGWNDEDDESDQIWASGLVVREISPRASNWRARGTLPEALAGQGVIGISGVDTRALTRHLRDHGSMRVGISSLSGDVAALLDKVRAQPTMVGADLASEVSVSEPVTVPALGDPGGSARPLSVVAIDLGIKSRTPYRLAERGVTTHILPASSSFEEVMAYQPDGLFFSNGPGDPATTTGPQELLHKALAAGLWFFGICFGHQVFARALGLSTYKLVYGHRGINQPVMDLSTRKVEITAHNHGFAVVAPPGGSHDTPYGQAKVSHVCLNDDVVEGLELRRHGQLVGFSVQYHPEAAAGPHDASYLFDRFIQMMRGDL